MNYYLVTFVDVSPDPVPWQKVGAAGPVNLRFGSIEVERERPLAYGESLDLAEQVTEAIGMEPGRRPIIQGVVELAPPTTGKQ